MWFQDRIGHRFPPLPGWVSIHVLSHTMLCVKKGCYKHTNPLGLRLNPKSGVYPQMDQIHVPQHQKLSFLISYFLGIVTFFFFFEITSILINATIYTLPPNLSVNKVRAWWKALPRTVAKLNPQLSFISTPVIRDSLPPLSLESNDCNISIAVSNVDWFWYVGLTIITSKLSLYYFF